MNKPSKEIKDKILFLWNKNKGKSFETFIKQNNDVNNYLENLVKSDKWFKNKRRAFVCVANGIYQKKLCEVCHKQIDLIKACKGRRFCSRKCYSLVENKKRIYTKQQIEKGNKKREQTNLLRYGCVYPMQSKNVREKHKQTCLQKYGVENVSYSKEIREKVKKTMIDKYGVDHQFKSQKVKEKSKKTCLQRYGVEYPCLIESAIKKKEQACLQKYGCKNPFQSKEIRQKIQNTCLQRYGARNVAHSKEIREKVKVLNIEKYGVENVFQSKEVKKRIKQTMIDRYGTVNYSQSRQYKEKIFKKFEKWKDYVVPLFTVDEYDGYRKKEYKWKCVKCGNEFEQHIHLTWIEGKSGYIPRCLNCYPYNINSSYIEKQIGEFIESIYNGQILYNDRKILNGMELDIYLPQKKIAVELDGLFWHNDKSGKDKNYHLNKTLKCEEQGVQLIHIFEDEWINKQDIVKDIIKSKLCICDKKIYARKCILKEINKNDANTFFELNNLYGKTDELNQFYGLYYNDELVMAISFKIKCFKAILTRVNTKINYQVIGGLSRLINALKCKYDYCIEIDVDRRYSNGDNFIKLGFKLYKEISSDYWWTKSQFKYSSNYCKKINLNKLLGNKYNDDLSVQENMYLNGYNKIYDCGSYIFIIK